MCVPERLQHASLYLARCRHRVDGNATVDGHRHLLHSHLTGIDINLDLDDLCSKRWRAFRRYIRRCAHDLFLFLRMQRIERNVFH